jgi:hypothetical protein
MVKVTKQIPHACPVCKGRGEIGMDQAQHGAEAKYTGFSIYACHVCSGSCLIWEIREEEVEKTPDLTGIQLPPSILTPTIQQPIQQTYPPYGVTWTSNVPPGFDASKIQTFNEITGDGNTCGCPKKGPHTIACMSTWNPRPADPAKNGSNCACAPWGQPHHDNCKAAY